MLEEGLSGVRIYTPRIATIDQDALVIETNKEGAMPTYSGYGGYQPVINYWAEKDIILADEFRYGNVPAHYDCYSSFRKSLEMLSGGSFQV